MKLFEHPTFDDLWPYMEQLSEDEIDELRNRALKDFRYRSTLLGAYGAMIGGVSVGMHALSNLLPPTLPFRLGLMILFFVAVWAGVVLFFRLGEVVFNQSMQRQIQRRLTHRPN